MINKFIENLKSTKNLSPKTLEAYSIDMKTFMQIEKNLFLYGQKQGNSYMRSSFLAIEKLLSNSPLIL